MHGRTRHFLTGLICGGLILGLSAAGFSRVFWKRRSQTLSEVLCLSDDWTRVLQSPVQINGSRGILDILGCEGDLQAATRSLKRACSEENKLLELEQGESMARALIETETGFLRTIAVQGADPDATLLFVLAQSPAEYLDSLSPPDGHSLNEPPCYPGSVAEAFIRVEETRAQLEISRTSSAPEAVRDFFQSALLSTGWVCVTPGAGSPSPPAGPLIFRKGEGICCVMVQPSRSDHDNVITVLHKRLETE